MAFERDNNNGGVVREERIFNRNVKVTLEAG